MTSPFHRLDDAVRRLDELTRDRLPTGLGHDDAPDDLGTVATDDAVGFDPRPLLRSLHEQGARVVVMGQVAGILHGSDELTGDLDLLWDGDPAQSPLLAAAFDAVGADLLDDGGRPVPVRPESFVLPKLQFATPRASGDLCTPALPWGDLPVARFLDEAHAATEADGFTVRYVSMPALIAMRRAVGRPKDLRRADALDGILAELNRRE